MNGWGEAGPLDLRNVSHSPSWTDTDRHMSYVHPTHSARQGSGFLDRDIGRATVRKGQQPLKHVPENG